MKSPFLFICFLILCLVRPVGILSQLSFDTINLEAKVSLNYTTNLRFDHQHNLWISTARGLYKIDGYSAKYYVFNPNDSLSLINNRVYNTYEDRDGVFWVLTDKGVQSYNQDTETFHSILQNYVSSQKELYTIGFTCGMQIDTTRLLFGTKSGCVIYNKSTKKYSYHKVLPDNTNRNDGYSSLAHVVDIIKDPSSNDNFYLLTRSGIIQFNSKNDSFQKIEIGNVDFHNITTPGLRLRIKDSIAYIVIRRDIYTYNFQTKKTNEYHIDAGNIELGLIRDFIFYKEDQLLVSTANSGFYIIKLNEPDYLSKYIDGSFNKLCFDSKGYLWTILETSKLLRSKESIKDLEKVHEFVGINRFWVNDIPLLKRDIKKEEIFKLKDFQRKLGVEVAFHNPLYKEDITYSYQLLPRSQTWKPIPDSRKLTFDKLKPDNYHLKIKAQINKNEYYSEPFKFSVAKYFYETWWFKALILSTISLFLLSTYYLINSRKRERVKHQRNILSMELDALRSQMNPHFLFNTLNSIKNYVLTKTPDEAAHYLTRFAQLIRNILENSKSEFLTLEQELETMKLYVEMEHLRFGKDFTYEFNVDNSINVSTFKVAPMLIQPYVENAIWHGLMNKRGKRNLQINLSKTQDGVKCQILDNGIGRTASTELYKDRPNKKSLGLKITQDRINNINLLYDFESSVHIEDILPMGTKVTIYLPEIK